MIISYLIVQFCKGVTWPIREYISMRRRRDYAYNLILWETEERDWDRHQSIMGAVTDVRRSMINRK
jgi:hypothetical protein